MSARPSVGGPALARSNVITVVWRGAKTTSTEALFSSGTIRLWGASALSSPLASTPEVMVQSPAVTFQPVMAAFTGRSAVLKAMTLKWVGVAPGTRIATCSAASGRSKRQLTVAPGHIQLRFRATPPRRERCRSSDGISTRSLHQWPSVIMYMRWLAARISSP